jgi:hypothetical protein
MYAKSAGTTAVAAAMMLAAIVATTSANALSAARVFVNVKITAAVDPTNADALADQYCASKGYAYAASYKNRLIVPSAGYMRFASLRCQGAAGEAPAATDKVAAAE